MKELRHRLVKVAQSHAASEWQSSGLNSGHLAAVSGPLPQPSLVLSSSSCIKRMCREAVCDGQTSLLCIAKVFSGAVCDYFFTLASTRPCQSHGEWVQCRVASLQTHSSAYRFSLSSWRGPGLTIWKSLFLLRASWPRRPEDQASVGVVNLE